MFRYIRFYNFLLGLYSSCWLNKVFSSNMFKCIFESLNAIRNLHEVRLPNIYIPWNVICHIVSLAIIIVLSIKAAGFSKVRQSLSNIFTMDYDDIKDLTWIFLLLMIFYYFRLKKFIASWLKRWKDWIDWVDWNIELISYFKHA